METLNLPNFFFYFTQNVLQLQDCRFKLVYPTASKVDKNYTLRAAPYVRYLYGFRLNAIRPIRNCRQINSRMNKK
jgi:hypothetical protein